MGEISRGLLDMLSSYLREWTEEDTKYKIQYDVSLGRDWS